MEERKSTFGGEEKHEWRRVTGAGGEEGLATPSYGSLRPPG